MIEVSYFDDLDRSFLKFSSLLGSMYRSTFGRLGSRLVAPLDGNAGGKTQEIALRTLIFLGALFGFLMAGPYIVLTAAVLGGGSKIFRGVGFYFQKNGFTHVRGSAAESPLKGQATVMTWNIHSGGKVLESSQIDRIVSSIRAENPDVVVLQEVYDTDLIETLIAKLQGCYAHFYTHLGPSTWGKESGCMVLAKCAVHSFSQTQFTNHETDINRGFQILEVNASADDTAPCARIIGAQLTPDKGAQEKRMEQLTQIINTLAKQKVALPTFFVGSLSVHQDSKEEEEAFLSKYLSWGYQGEANALVSLFKRNLSDGRVLPVIEKNIRLLDSHVLKELDERGATAPTDPHAIVTTFGGLKAAAVVH